MNSFMMVIGFIVSIFSFLIFCGGLGNLFKESNKDVAFDIVMLVFFLCMGIGGFYLGISNRKKKIQKDSEEKESKILPLIVKKGGRVSPIELAAESKLTIEETKKILERLCEKGIGYPSVTEEGHVIYLFDVQSANDKSFK